MAPGEFWVPLEPDGSGERRSVVVLPSPRIVACLIPIWQTNAPAFVKFVREHQCPSFLEYGEYPYVSADEIKKALKLKAAFSNMLDQMQ